MQELQWLDTKAQITHAGQPSGGAPFVRSTPLTEYLVTLQQLQKSVRTTQENTESNLELLKKVLISYLHVTL